mgnify:CR=1 FL=1
MILQPRKRHSHYIVVCSLLLPPGSLPPRIKLHLLRGVWHTLLCLDLERLVTTQFNKEICNITISREDSTCTFTDALQKVTKLLHPRTLCAHALVRRSCLQFYIDINRTFAPPYRLTRHYSQIHITAISQQQ